VSRTSIPIWLLLAAALFVVALAALVIQSVSRDPPPGYPISDLPGRPEATGLIADRVITLDARDADRWTRLDLSRTTVADDASRWDLAARRFRLIVNGGPGFAGEAGVISQEGGYEAIVEAPPDGYVGSSISAGGDTVNSELARWYDYGFFSHLLTPKDIAYVLRTADGRYAKFRIIGYYCPGAEPGCLTIEYTYQGDGSRRLIE
jgi:hypothetical protein